MKVTEEQKKFLNKYIKAIDEVLTSGDVNDLLLEIDATIVSTFDDEGNPSDVGIKLQSIYDDILANN